VVAAVQARRGISDGALAVLALLVTLAWTPAVASAAPCDAPIANPVACENTKPGSPASEWSIVGAGDASIQGYATQMSVNKGAQVSFKIKAPTDAYTIRIYRLGYYGAAGARLIDGPLVPTSPDVNQPPCPADATTGLIDCANWSISHTWTVPSDAVSGVYIARLRRNDTGGASHITFVVRDDASHSDVVLSTSDADWQAYNDYGGNSLYTCTVSCPGGNPSAYKGAFKVSYNRPFHTAEAFDGRPWLFHAEYSMIRFLEASGYDLSYTTSVDIHRDAGAALLRNHRMFMSSGQDEYWSDTQRAHVETARDAGVNLAFFSGNEIYWKTRWENGDRTLVSYKDTHLESPGDVELQDPVAWTGTWQDPRFSPPEDGGRPQNALTGQVFSVNTGPGMSSTAQMTVRAEYGKLRLWRNTPAATLAPGASRALAPSTIGFEWDEDFDNGFRPAGQIRLSSTTVAGAEIFIDYGSRVALAPATHTLTMHRAPSGALVFGAGTVQWSWGLDPENPGHNPVDNTMRQATVNLLADLGAQPYVLLPGLVAAGPSGDAARPSSTLLTAPVAVTDGDDVTVSGTASDSGGGVVAGVEVSTDDGATWHPATTGTTSWSYDFVAHGNPTVVRTRATDDSANTEIPDPGTRIDAACPCSLWGENVLPAELDANDGNPVELGVSFKSDTAVTVTGVRFFKAAANTGTHSGRLWRASNPGAPIREATFSGESATGWQTVSFATPVVLEPGATYIASYHAPNGHYSTTRGYFYPPPAPGPKGGGTVDAPPLHALRGAEPSTNGVFAYGIAGTFPFDSFGASNYWVDVVYEVAAPGPVTGVSAVAASPTSATVSWSGPTSGGSPTSFEITPHVNGAAQAPTVVTGGSPATVGGLTSATTYTFTVQAFNGAGQGPRSAQSNPVTPMAAPVPDPSGGDPLPAGNGAPPADGARAAPQPLPAARIAAPATNTVRASIVSTRVLRTRRGRRLQVVVKLGESVSVGVLVGRGTRTILKRDHPRLAPGNRTITVAIPNRIAAGKLRLRLTLKDAAGARRTVRRTIALPKLPRRR